MALTEGEKAEVKEMARAIVKEVLMEHVASCPHGARLARLLFLATGIGLGSGIGSGTIVMLMTKVFGV